MHDFSPASREFFAHLRAPLAAFFAGDDADAARRVLRALGRAGFGGITLAMPRDSEFAVALACLDECKALRLEAWLRAPLPDFGRGAGWFFQAQDIGKTQAQLWRAPNVYAPGTDTPHASLLSIVAAPLENARPDWSRAASLLELDDAQRSARLTELASGESARLWVWHQEIHATDDLWWLESTPEFLRNCQSAGVCEALRGIYLEAPEKRDLVPHRFPATPDLARAFAAQHGYDVLAHLPSLIADTGAGAVRVRGHFWQSLAAEHARFWRDIKARCLAWSLPLRGALCDEISLVRAIASCGDVPQALRALDSISVVARDDDDFLQARLAASIAALAGLNATAQCRGNASWSQTPQQSLARLHQMLHCGITIFETHAARADCEAAAPSVAAQPFASEMRGFNERVARLGSALSCGRSGARIAILWPQRSLQAHWNPRGHRITRWVEEDLHATAKLLDGLHFEFLFLPEDDLCAAVIEESTPEFRRTFLRCGAAAHAFEMIVLPSVSTLSRAAWRRLEAFVEAGGKVVCLGLLPRWNEDGRDAQFEEHIGKTTMLVVEDLYDAYAAAEGRAVPGDDAASVIGYPVVRSKSSGGRLGCYQPRLNADADDARLRVRQMLAESLPPELETGASEVLLSRRACDNGEMIFAVNASAKTQRVNLRARPERDGAPLKLDSQSGAMLPICEWTPLGEDADSMDHGLVIPLELGAGEAELIYIAHGENLPHAQRANFYLQSFDGHAMRGWATQSGTPLALAKSNASFANLERWSAPDVRLPPPLACDSWLAAAPDCNVLRLLTAEKNPAPRATFRLAENLADVPRLWLFAPMNGVQISLNNVPLSPLETTPFSDGFWANFCGSWFQLMGARRGENTIIATQSTPEFGRTSVAFVLGEFALSPENEIGAQQNLLLERGSWHEQGLPFFAGRLALRVRVRVPGDWRNCRVFFEISPPMRDVAALCVNEVSLGTRAAGPYRWDATKAIRANAENELTLAIWNSADALFSENDAVPAGILGAARLVAYPIIEIVKL